MAFQFNATGGANGFYELPDAVNFMWDLFLRYRVRLFRPTGKIPDLFCGSRHLDHRNYMEPHLASLFPFWSIRMVVAKFDLLEKTTVQKK